eukprot:1149361-Pelagomonas_calceolata.AAC.1
MRIAQLYLADEVAKNQASLKGNNLTDNGTPSAGLGGNPFFNIAWMAQEEKRLSKFESPLLPSSRTSQTLGTPSDALKPHMHAKHRLRYADLTTSYCTYYHSLIPHANKDISNAFWNISCISFRMKHKIFQYHTGTLYNHKHAVCFNRSTSHVCHHTDSAVHILSSCQCPVICNMVTERHNIASRMAPSTTKHIQFKGPPAHYAPSRLSSISQHTPHAFRLPESYHIQHLNATMSLTQCVSFSLIDVGKVCSAYSVFFSFFVISVSEDSSKAFKVKRGKGYQGCKGKRPQSRRLTASLFINTHKVMKGKRKYAVILVSKIINILGIYMVNGT